MGRRGGRAGGAPGAKIASEDLRCDPAKTGPAGAQVGEGEDPTAEERTKLQNLNVRSWLAQQEAEKAGARRRGEGRAPDAPLVKGSWPPNEADLEDEENEERSRVRYELRVKNEGDAERKQCCGDEKTRGGSDPRPPRSIGRLNDPELCENTAVARSALGAHRYRPDHFKGLRAGTGGAAAENDTLVRGELRREIGRSRSTTTTTRAKLSY